MHSRDSIEKQTGEKINSKQSDFSSYGHCTGNTNYASIHVKANQTESKI